MDMIVNSLPIIILSIVLLISISINFYLYRIKRYIMNNKQILVPEEWGKYLDSVGDNVGKLENSLNKNIDYIIPQISEILKKIVEMTETYMTLHNSLDEKDSEIRRLKKGYDTEIFHKFIYRFIRVDQLIEDYLSTGEYNQNSLEQIKRLLNDAFDECDVESFSPKIGDDYRRTFGVADNPNRIKTEKLEEEFLIAEVLENGYRLRRGSDYEVILPSKVSIYRYED